MNSPPDRQYRQSSEHLAASLIEDYLDHFTAPLVGIVPHTERKSLRDEVSDHLEGLTQEFIWQGMGSLEAVRAALGEMGEPWPIGEAFVAEWMQDKAVRSQRFSPAALRPFAFFGVASLLNLLLIQYYALPSDGGAFIPLVIVLSFLSPLVAGLLTGISSTPRLAATTLTTIALLTLHSAVTGYTMLPVTDGLRFAGFQLLWWLPAGTGSLLLAQLALRRYQRHRFLRAAVAPG